MADLPDPLKAFRFLDEEKTRGYYSLKALKETGIGDVSRLPVSIRIVLEALVRHCDGVRVTEDDVRALARWSPAKVGTGDVPFVVSRVILQDFTGVPLMVDLAAMRDAVAAQGKSPTIIEPLVPVDLVVDHSVQVDRARTDDAFAFNLKTEYLRNQERYAFLKWGQQAFKTFTVVPPGIGIVHQVNLEYLASVVTSHEVDGIRLVYPDTLVGTDSHTTMINGLGVVGWGVGGIEAEAAMLGQPVALQMPEVIGVQLTGRLRDGVTATDLTLRITELLRAEKVVGKFVEFFGEGSASLSVADRATIGNMAPEYGATMGFFPVDGKTLEYLRMTGRSEANITQVKEYLEAQGLFGIPSAGQIDYTKVIKLDLNLVNPCVAGPKRPQDRIDLPLLKAKFEELLLSPVSAGGFGITPEKRNPKICVQLGNVFPLTEYHLAGGVPVLQTAEDNEEWSEAEMVTNRPVTYVLGSEGDSAPVVRCDAVLGHGSVVIAAITSCTNTSNPEVMLAAGLVAKKAVEKGLKVNPKIKTSLAPGSRVVTDYLQKTGLDKPLESLGFHLVAYGCTTCIGNSGPLDESIEKAIKDHDLVAASVLSGNRNFEARIHGSVKANFLMSPPLVVAFALAGRVDIDMDSEPLTYDPNGNPVFLHDLWPTEQEIANAITQGIQPEMFQKRYANIHQDSGVWNDVAVASGARYGWDSHSTYIQEPPYFEHFSATVPSQPTLKGMRALALLGDSVTTDHISPAGAFKADSPAGKYLMNLGVKPEEFNSYGSRRGNHQVMMRGTFANVRIRNQMAEGKEGGFTKLVPDGTLMPIFDAAQIYAERQVPLIVLAGKDYGMGSSRDWAAKGAALLGVKVVVAQSFERIHRSNLIGMGVLPLEFLEGQSHESLGIKGDELFTLTGFDDGLTPRQLLMLEVEREGKIEVVKLLSRLDTPIEVEYYKHGGIMPYVLRQL